MIIERTTFDKLFQFKDIEDSPNYIYYKISFEERIFGYLIFEKKDYLELKKIYVKSKFRNSGYGSKLLNYAIYDSINLTSLNKIVVNNHRKLNNFLEKNDFININGSYIRTGIENEYNNLKSTLRVNKISILINMILSFFKLFIGYTFRINSLIADGINSFSDMINNILILIGAKIGTMPNDEDHPLGHGKIESIFSLIVGVLIVVSSLNIMKDSFIILIKKEFIVIVDKYITILVVSALLIVVKLIQYTYVYIVSKKYNNQLIKALLIDYNVDIILSTTVLVSIIGSRYIDKSLDSILSIIITSYLIKQGYDLIKENALILMDSQDENLLLNVKLLTLEIDEIKNVHDMYMTTIGNSLYIFADIRLNENLSLKEAHSISERAERHVKFKYSNIKKVIYHIEPDYSEE